MSSTAKPAEVAKLQQHLSLLTDQYAQLQLKYTELDHKYKSLAATNGFTEENTFAAKLIAKIKTLYDNNSYSDVRIKLKGGRVLRAHRLVLYAHSETFSGAVAKGVGGEVNGGGVANAVEEGEVLDWSEMEAEVAEVIVKWMYTETVQIGNNDELTLKVIRQAFTFHLPHLVHLLEDSLISTVTVHNCVKYYSVAEEINAGNLREYCSGLISAHWHDLTPDSFEHMSGPLLHEMLKTKATLPLHSAVRLQREDVVFLCLVENSSWLSNVVNVWSPEGELPLEMALRSHNTSVASTLLQHNADINIRDSEGETLLHRAIKHEDAATALFLLDNNCDVTLTTRAENESALHLLAGISSIDNSVKIAEKLISKSININAQNRQGFTALHIAISADNRPIFDALLGQQRPLDLGLRTSSLGHPALYYALCRYEAGDRDEGDNYAGRLLEYGAGTHVVYEKGDTAEVGGGGGDSLVQVLLRQGKGEAAMWLVGKSGEDWNCGHVNASGESPLHTACSPPTPCPAFLPLALGLGAHPNVITHTSRQSALHYAVKANSAECIDAFVAWNEGVKEEEEEEEEGERGRGQVDFNVRDGEGETPLSLALKEKNTDLVPILIKGNADVNIRNAKDYTLLHQAILEEDAKTALFLLDNGADINAKTSEYETPLQLAIHCRLGEVVDALCTRGVDMSAPDRLGNCPLWAALDSAQDDIGSILVRHGADTDCWGAGPEGCTQTLLHRAIDENNEAAAIFLIQAGADLDSPRMPGPNGEGGDESKDKASPLHLCCEWGLEAVVQTLVEHGANVDARDSNMKTPIHLAIENAQDAIISLLLSVPGLDLSLRDKAGLSPFATALTHRNNRAAQSILDKLPSAAEQFDARGQNFLHTAIKKGDLENVLFLLSVHVDVNSRVQNPSLTPPLHLAASSGNETLLRSLLLAGARIQDRDSHKKTALHVAAECGNAAIVTALLQNNVDYDATDANGDNALHIAVREGHLGVVRVLLTESSINAEAVNLKGRNPLHELCRFGKDNSAAICELFFECMAAYPIDKPDLEGNSPLLLAYTKGNGHLCRALVKLNACLASENNERITIFNYQVASKQLLHRLLDQLAAPGPWPTAVASGAGEACQECGRAFTLTVRRHHCRHCGRLLCARCSDQEVPVLKFGENKPVRVCKVCFDVLKVGVVGVVGGAGGSGLNSPTGST